MLKTFVLIASFWNPAAGQADAFVLDYNMSGADCVAVLVDVYQAEAIEISPGFTVRPADVVLSCEIDEHA